MENSVFRTQGSGLRAQIHTNTADIDPVEGSWGGGGSEREPGARMLWDLGRSGLQPKLLGVVTNKEICYIYILCIIHNITYIIT